MFQLTHKHTILILTFLSSFLNALLDGVIFIFIQLNFFSPSVSPPRGGRGVPSWVIQLLRKFYIFFTPKYSLKMWCIHNAVASSNWLHFKNVKKSELYPTCDLQNVIIAARGVVEDEPELLWGMDWSTASYLRTSQLVMRAWLVWTSSITMNTSSRTNARPTRPCKCFLFLSNFMCWFSSIYVVNLNDMRSNRVLVLK